MDETRLDFLRTLIASPSPSGFEQPVQEVIRTEISKYADAIRTDVHGNVIASLNSEGSPRVMLTAHCDELGFIIRYIDEQGFLYFAPIGGFDPSTLPGERVHVHTPKGPLLGVIGSKAIHLMDSEERSHAPNLKNMWIDIGVSGRDEAQLLVPIGSVATRAQQLEILRDELVVSRALDNKSGIFTIVEAMRRLHNKRDAIKAGVYFVSTVQEETGLRGVRTSTYEVNPQVALIVDVTFASDHPETSKRMLGDVKLHGGPGLTIGGFTNPRVYQLLVNAATQADIPYQHDIQASYTNTDNDFVQISRGGVATGLINIPCRYMHSGSEIVSLKDIDNAAKLVVGFVLALDNYTNLIP